MPSAVAAIRTKERIFSLSTLKDRSFADLEQMYRSAKIPESLSPLKGHPRGRMLATRYFASGPVANALRNFAFASSFPWEGKSFTSSAKSGTGVNRVRLGGRHALFPFITKIAPSLVDDKPCVVLDYDLADNPSLIRMIHDEVREVDDGLYLGPAMRKIKNGSPELVLWFAVDFHEPMRPIGEARRLVE